MSKFENVFRGIKEKMLIDFNDISSAISHRGAKGRVREIEIVTEYLQRYLPGHIGVANGECVATNGSVSPECDIILFEKNSTPYLVHKEGYQVFPIECVYGVIEVKSRLDKKELRDSIAKIAEIKSMPKVAYDEQRGPIVNETTLYGRNWKYFPTIGLLFAYDSIELETLKQHYIEEQVGLPLEKQVDSVWVLQKGMLIQRNRRTGTIELGPSPETDTRIVKSDNPLLLLTIQLQTLMGLAWLPRFKIVPYLHGADFGKIES